jgi:hypothetical protein
MEEIIFVVRLAFFIQHLWKGLLELKNFIKKQVRRSRRRAVPAGPSEMHQNTVENVCL